MRILPHRLPCGCWTDGRVLCEEHRPREASWPLALLGAAAFCAVLVGWAGLLAG